MILALLLACAGDDGGDAVSPGDDGAAITQVEHPFVAVRADDRQAMLDRLELEPWATLYQRTVEQADLELEADADGEWDHEVVGHNALVAQANALLAWLHDDPERAALAMAAFDVLETDFENNSEWDVNIRMPRPLIGYSSAWDLLVGGGFLTTEQEDGYAGKVIAITDAFFDAYVDDDATRSQLLGFAQNNHPLRTAAAVGVPGLVFRDRSDHADEWLSWAASETAWLLSEQGQYVMADGGVSEGPFYYAFGLSAVLGFLVAMDNAQAAGALDPDGDLVWDCRNRVDYDPFTTTGCTEGAAMSWDNPLHQPYFQRSLSWSLTLRLPDGMRAPLADANMVQQNGGAIVAAAVLASSDASSDMIADASAWTWDWLDNDWYPADTTRAFDLTAQHLARLTPAQVEAAAPPAWRSTVLEAAGNAVLRSGWGGDDLWALLVAEHDSARKTLHDHVDGLSFSLAAFGEYLLLDPGYYKPSDLDNAVTADADSHNVILVDGQGAPDKGLLVIWGDTDAYLGASYDSGGSGGDGLVYAEASEDYQGVSFHRGLLMVRDRYVLVLDRTEGDGDSHDFSWRLGGWAGYDAGGSFSPGGQGARWERDLAGVDVTLAASRAGLSVVEPALVEGLPPHVHQFDRDRSLGEHGVIDGELRAVEPGFVAALAPYRVGVEGGDADGPLAVTVFDLGEGVAALQVETADGRDVALVRELDGPTELSLPDGRRVQTDARVVFLGDGTRQGVVIDGSWLVVDGVDLLEGATDSLVAWTTAAGAR